MKVEALAMRPGRLIRLALLDHYHQHNVWPQRVVLYSRAFQAFLFDLDPWETPGVVRPDGSVLFMGVVPVYPSVRPMPPYLINYQGRPEEL